MRRPCPAISPTRKVPRAVAAIAAGSTTGVAVQANIISVRVLNCDGNADVVDVVDGLAGLSVTDELRAAGFSADRAFDGRSMKSQMKAADRSGAVFAVIVGSDEAAAGTCTVRNLSTSEQSTLTMSTSPSSDSGMRENAVKSLSTRL